MSVALIALTMEPRKPLLGGLIGFELIPPQLADINLMIYKISTVFCKLAPNHRCRS